MKKVFSLLLLGLCAVFLAAATGHADPVRTRVSEAHAVRRIMPGDRLRISVEEQPELNRVYAVAGDGTIDFDLLGRVPIAEQTAVEAAEYLEALLEEGFFRRASVTVDVADFVEGAIQVVGAVGSPGTIAFRGDEIMTLMEAITMKGGLSRDAAGNEVKILRWKPGGSMEREVITVDVQTMFEDLDFSNDQYLRPRDMIYVPRMGEGDREGMREYLALGEFNSPGFHPHSTGMDMIRAVTRAGGISRQGQMTAARILRVDDRGNYEAIPVDLSLLFSAADMSMNMPIQPGDILFVPSSEHAARGQVYFLGEVGRPGAVPLPPERSATLARMILANGGFTRFANESRVRVLREAPDGTKQTLTVNVGRILKTGAFEDDVPLQDGDVVIVPESIIAF